MVAGSSVLAAVILAISYSIYIAFQTASSWMTLWGIITLAIAWTVLFVVAVLFVVIPEVFHDRRTRR